MKYYPESQLEKDKNWLEGVVIWSFMSIYYFMFPLILPFESYLESVLAWLFIGTLLALACIFTYRTYLAIYRVHIKKVLRRNNYD